MGFVVITGGFTLDDTVLLNNEVRRRAIGGNIVYAAVGAKIWHEHVGLFGVAGHDYPQEHLDYLTQHGLDVSGITRVKEPCLKMWALLEGGNARQLIYRLDSGDNESMDPRVEFATDEYVARATAVHIAAIPVPSQRALIERFRKDDICVSMDTIDIPGRIDPKPLKELKNLAGVDVFLPSYEEIESIYGKNADLKAVMRTACEDGKRNMVVKLGNKGCLAYDAKKDVFYSVPVYPADAKDTTGAGDSFCGGFLAGMDICGDVLESAVMGCVSASFNIEDFGAVHAIDTSREAAKARFDKVYKNVERI